VESVQSRLDRGVLKMGDLTEAEALAIIQGLISQEVGPLNSFSPQWNEMLS
jgi:hypothetical protein